MGDAIASLATTRGQNLPLQTESAGLSSGEIQEKLHAEVIEVRQITEIGQLWLATIRIGGPLGVIGYGIASSPAEAQAYALAEAVELRVLADPGLRVVQASTHCMDISPWKNYVDGCLRDPETIWLQGEDHLGAPVGVPSGLLLPGRTKAYQPWILRMPLFGTAAGISKHAVQARAEAEAWERAIVYAWWMGRWPTYTIYPANHSSNDRWVEQARAWAVLHGYDMTLISARVVSGKPIVTIAICIAKNQAPPHAILGAAARSDGQASLLKAVREAILGIELASQVPYPALAPDFGGYTDVLAQDHTAHINCLLESIHTPQDSDLAKADFLTVDLTPDTFKQLGLYCISAITSRPPTSAAKAMAVRFLP